ncbi:MAG: hypothetical protein HC918_13365, partial [Oscillatoriales cyanobacterium SM2_1_8]|nr:hypothetical protein [Oscillatoriales cyanobacterium SM2_1_8]
MPTKTLAARQQEVRQELAAKRADPFSQLPGTAVVVVPPRPVLPPPQPVSRPTVSPQRRLAPSSPP